MSDQKNDPKIERRKNEILGLFLITFAAISYFAIFSNSAGLLGDYMSRGYYFLVGSGSYILPLLFVYWGIQLIRSKTIKFSAKFLGLIISFIAIISIINLNEGGNLFLNTPQNAAGGVIGGAITYFLVELFAVNGAYIILSVLLLIGILLLFDLFLHNIFRKTKAVISSFNQLLRNLKENIISFFSSLTLGRFNIFSKLKENRKKKKDKKKNDLNKPELESKNIVEEKNTGGSTEVQVENAKNNKSSKTAKMKDKKNKNKKSSRTKKEIEEEKNKEITEDFDISKDQSKDIKGQGEKHGDYTLPGILLLNDSGKKKVKLANKSELLEETLNSFGVEAKVINVNHGPTITRYEIQPATGVKVSKIVNLSDDIALALAARDVRIEAPIPGKAAVGIEVPHGNDITVSFRDVIVSEEFQKAEDKLTLALGKGIDGDTAVFNLAKMPHLLVAGATGSGKSVCINTLISSILYRATPEEVKLLLVDPKKVELNIYQGLPHLITPVVTDSKKAANVLKLVVEEMENRYDLFSDTGSRGIESYNEKLDDPEDKMPYIVVIIDELSDLMMVAANEVEDNICRLAQMSRAAGIHLIIATQRPSVDVITGLIKANIPSRISFAVSSATDSRTILDMGGAEKLLGKGDMLFAPVGMQKPQRIQGAFLTDKEISDITAFVKEQATAEYKIGKNDIKEVELSIIDDEQDELYEEAVKLVVKYRASISMLQRRLHIGHSRAARLIDSMEEDGIVGPYAGSKPRQVLVEEDDLEAILNGEYDNEAEAEEKSNTQNS
ncbi:FtsK/SpoIIIE family DNA translocase [Halanaerobium congolense]|jgi:S-DNA-T family DNA segregation ATPase FtsK/SpoIIIE|uniref:DNA translocase FtsK n=1 Tax=Halanaerobium congolense TaxID=54121 RepID=A0A1G6P332_9FIRM|nr:DNA translocase FtsK [Halanaerobium congolense]KXS50330.1 MAG: DNA segregation ATPase FtsK/SpoIIIE, S-DNA-T family [Halanaerobium sp. T82-1]TDP11528.1 DNA translocase FtsK [Halanaerobium congolense]SDC74680.1 DNA translocase FtsK [Halanaerobium congolense]